MLLRRDLYAATVFCITLGLIFTLIATGAGAFNSFRNPISYIASYQVCAQIFSRTPSKSVQHAYQGLWIWHTVAAVSYFLALAIYGAMFAQDLSAFPANGEVIREGTPEWNSDGRYTIGYSYWLIFVSMVSIRLISSLIAL